MSSPRQDPISTPLPARTPGWTQGLFGILTSSKKALPVGSSTVCTSDSASPLKGSRSVMLTKLELSSSRTTDNHAATASPDPAIAPSVSTAFTLASKAMLSPTGMPSAATSKSPWKSPALNGVASSHGSRKVGGTGKKVVAFSAKKSSSRRLISYRPNSALLVKPKVQRKSIDPTLAVNALERSKGAFAPSTRQIEVKKNFATFKTGKRMWGAHQRASRLPPPPSDPMSTEVDSGLVPAGDFLRNNKHQKKVSFTKEESENAIVAEVATPVRIEKPRKATPFKVQGSDGVRSLESSPNTKSRQKYPPLPSALEYILRSPFKDYKESEDAGDPVPGATRTIFEIPVQASGEQSLRWEMPLFDVDKYALTKSVLENSKQTKMINNNAQIKITQDSEEPEHAAKKRRTGEWECVCKTKNPDDETYCKTCRKIRPASKVQEGWGNAFDKYELNKGWKCPACNVRNSDSASKCASCETPRSKASSTPASSLSAPSTSGTAKFSFAASGSKPSLSQGGGTIHSSGFKFGGSVGGTSGYPASSQSKESATGGFAFSTIPAAASSDVGRFTFGDVTQANNQGTGSTSNESGFVFGSAIVASGFTDKKGESKSESKPSVQGKQERSPSSSGIVSNEGKSVGFSFGSPAVSSIPSISFKAPDAKKTVTESAKVSFSFPEKPQNSLENGDRRENASVTSDSARGEGMSTTSSTSSAGKEEFTTPSSISATKLIAIPPSDSSQARIRPSDNQDIQPPNSATRGTEVNHVFSFGSKPAFDNSKGEDADNSGSTNAYLGSPQPEKPSTVTPAPSFAFGSSAPTPKVNDNAPISSKPAIPQISFGTTFSSSGADDRSKRRRNLDDGRNEDFSAATFGANPSAAPQVARPFTFGNTPVPSSTEQYGSILEQAKEKNGKGISSGQDLTKATATIFGAAQSGEAKDTPNLFGGGPAAGQTSVAFSFGQQTAQPSSAAPAPFSFGSSSVSGQGKGFGSESVPQPVSAPMFGNSVPASSSTPAPMFGNSTVSAPPTFGSPGLAQQASTAAPSSGFGLGSTTPNPFGAAPAQAVQTPAFSFGAATPSGFGSTPAPSAPGAVSFGSTPAPSVAGGFGSVPGTTPGGFGMPPATATPGFSFGGQPQPPSGAAFPPFGSATPGPAQTPSFGGFGNPSPVPNPGMGGFGSNQPQQPSGFSGGFATNPSTPGMGMNSGAPQFSIGSGGGQKSTRGRRLIKAKRPGQASAPRQA